MKSNFSIPGFLMLLLTLACIALIIKGLQAVLKRTGWEETRRKRIFTISTVAILLWAVLLSVLSFQDFFSDFSSLPPKPRSEEHTSELQSHSDLVCRLLLEKKKKQI